LKAVGLFAVVLALITPVIWVVWQLVVVGKLGGPRLSVLDVALVLLALRLATAWLANGDGLKR
jgi:hypothetical protein